MQYKTKPPMTLDGWLEEIVNAYCDAMETIPFGPLAGKEITHEDLFHVAPIICLKFRGIKRNKRNSKLAAEAALCSYIATKDRTENELTDPCISFALCYVASHYGLDFLGEEEAVSILDYIESRSEQLIEKIKGKL